MPKSPETWNGLASLARVGFALALAVGITGDPRAAFAGTVPRRTAAVEAIAKVQPCVVNISSEKKAASSSRWPFSAEENARPRVSGMGTGVLIDPRGYILTNHHVVDKVQGIEAQLFSGAVYPAHVVQDDKVHDLAILKIDAGQPLPYMPMGTSADLMVGEEVITIGNAFGYENTVSIGIISALKRNVTLSDDQVYRNLIQTDACINPGNSGGPLININGELIGINVAVRAGAQGIGFALPIDDVKRVATSLLSTRRVSGTWHGLAGEEAIEGENRAVYISEVKPASPSLTAGFQAGDRLIKIGSNPIVSSFDVERCLLDARPDAAVPVTVSRRGKEMVLGLTVEALPRPTATDATSLVWQALGVKAVPVGPEHVSSISPRLRGGLLVESVYPNGPAARSEFAPGDILVGMQVGEGHWETIQPDNVIYILEQHRKASGQPLQYYLIHQNAIRQGAIDVPKVGTAAAAGATRR